MSADNAYVVWNQDKGMPAAEDKWHVAHIFMSPYMEDCLTLKDKEPQASFPNREKAIVHAHDLVKNDYIVEYGVIEGKIPERPCGMCWVCVNERNIISRKMPHCDKCGKALVGSYNMTSEGTFCSYTCDPW